LIVGSAIGQVAPGKELSIGRRLEAEIELKQELVTDAEVLGFSNRVLKNLSRQESLRVPLELKIVDDPDAMIASALPGGILLLSSGAILAADNEAELAGLLSHAMGHAQTGQLNRPAQWASSTVPVIFVSGEWGLCERSNDGSRPSMLTARRAAQASLIEAQADMLGLGYMVNGGYAPQALISVFEHWSGKLRPDEEVKGISDSISNVAAVTVLRKSAFDQMKARFALSPASQRQRINSSPALVH
jgi:predicted Zn-dependent protease